MFEDEQLYLKELLLSEIANLKINIENIERRLSKEAPTTPYTLSHIANRVDKYIHQLELLARLKNGS